MKDKVTEVQVIPVKPKDGLVAIANCVFDNSFYFASIGIYTRPRGGYRLTYPTRKLSTYNISIFHPINKKIAHAIEDAIVAHYEAIVSGNEHSIG